MRAELWQKESGRNGHGHGVRIQELGNIPEILAIDELDTDVATAFFVETGIDDTSLGAAAFIASTKNDGAVDFNRMAADEAGSVAANHGSPGFLFPGVAAIFAAQPNGDGSKDTRTATEIAAQMAGTTKNLAQADLIGRGGPRVVAESLGLVDARGKELFQAAEG